MLAVLPCLLSRKEVKPRKIKILLQYNFLPTTGHRKPELKHILMKKNLIKVIKKKMHTHIQMSNPKTPLYFLQSTRYFPSAEAGGVYEATIMTLFFFHVIT